MDLARSSDPCFRASLPPRSRGPGVLLLLSYLGDGTYPAVVTLLRQNGDYPVPTVKILLTRVSRKCNLTHKEGGTREYSILLESVWQAKGEEQVSGSKRELLV